MPYPTYTVHCTQGYRYIDEGPTTDLPPVVLLHGMLGNTHNWHATIRALSTHGFRVIVPLLPVYDLLPQETGVPALAAYLDEMLTSMNLAAVVLAGNSLGGHIALLYALEHPENLSALVLSGASGVYEVGLGTETLRRRDRSFIRERAARTFYNATHVTPALIEEMYEIINDRHRALCLIKLARSVQAETVTDRLGMITAPTLLIWGQNDDITPPEVAETFRHHIPKAQLRYIDECGHAPMIEHPIAFNQYLLDFLDNTLNSNVLTTTDSLKE